MVVRLDLKTHPKPPGAAQEQDRAMPPLDLFGSGESSSIATPISPRPSQGELSPLGRGLSFPDLKPLEYDEKSPLQKLGQGKFGEVFLAGSTPSQFILKRINFVDAISRARGSNLDPSRDNSQDIEKLLVEARAMQRVTGYPHIPRFLGSRRTGDFLEIGMEYCPGKSIKEVPLNETAVKSAMTQLLTTLHFCHNNGVAHLDVKPENLLFDSLTGHLTLIDFGEARFFEPKNPVIDKHFSAGTPAYRRELDPGKKPIEIDIYAAGKTCEKLLKNIGTENSPKAQELLAEWLGNPQISIPELLKNPWFIN